LSVRVVPRDDFGTWVIREPTSKIFTSESVRQITLPQANRFQDQFQIYFCDDLDDLMKHYFHDFDAEGVREPYRMFTGSWRTPTTVKYFGISESILKSDAGFVLVKLAKPKATLKIEGRPQLKPDASDAFQRIRSGDKESVEQFVQNHGSHYIESLTVGDVLVEKKVTKFDDIYDAYLAPWVVKENGKVLVASGDNRVGDFLKGRVFKQLPFASYPSIFEIRKQPDILDQLEFLTQDTTAVIALHFRSLGSLLPSLESQEFYKEIVNTELALWEANI